MALESFISKFKPDKKGLEKVLGHLEADVLKIVWDMGKVSVRDVYEKLQKQREIAYTTVMTIMVRLAKKKILKKEKEGLAHLYSPMYSREEFTTNMVQKVMDGILEDYTDLAFSHFVDRLNNEDDAKIQILEQILQKRAEKEK
jgi:predicted transcriptional regulator